jgi:hypothetical protein
LELQPTAFSSDFAGHLNVDGETLDEFLPVRVEALPRFWNVFVPGV